MKRLFISFCLVLGYLVAQAQYTDHRGHNIDSLEIAIAKWDAPALAKASDAELRQLSTDWRELMLAYLQINGVKSEYYARKALALGQQKGWELTIWDSAKVLGQHFWAIEKYDSAAVYYNIALEAIQQMKVVDKDSVVIGQNYSKTDKDNGLSAMYGTLGNLYSSMDSTDLAMSYYQKALEIFKQHDWTVSCAVCYANMGETMMAEGKVIDAEKYFELEMQCAEEANDSLWIANAWKHFGELNLQQGETLKAIKALDKADSYFSLHEDEEALLRLELLDFTSQVLRLQKRQLKWLLFSLVALLILLVSLIGMAFIFKHAKREKENTEAVLQETIEELRPLNTSTKREAPSLTDRELQILRLIAEGKTNPQIAAAVFLSPDTIKWYRKKLLVKFDAINSADLIRLAMEMKVI